MRRALPVALAAVALALALAPAASAAVRLGFAEAAHEASVLAPGTIDRGDEYVGYSVRLKNTGTSKSSGTASLSVTLPTGLELAGGGGEGWICHLQALTCTNGNQVEAGAEWPKLKLEAFVLANAADAPTASFIAYGAGAVGDAFASDSFSFGPATPFGISSISAGVCTAPPVGEPEVRSCKEAEEQGATPYTTAGGHPFAASTSFAFGQRVGASGNAVVAQSVRDLFTDLPAGFIGNPRVASPLCTAADVRENSNVAELCPASAAVGGIGVLLRGIPGESTPIYRIVPESGYVAAFAFRPSDLGGPVTVILRVKLRSNGDYGVSAITPWVPQNPEFLAVRFATLCGYGARTTVLGHHIPNFTGCKYPGKAGANGVPFITNPTSCPGSEPVTAVSLDSYEHPGTLDGEGRPVLSDPDWKISEAASPPIVGCNHLEFEPSFEGRPTTNVADAPSGLDFSLHFPQSGLVQPTGLAEAHLKDTTVAFPAGVTVNPSAASGLAACSSRQIGLASPIGTTPVRFSGLPDECPAASKLGTVEVSTPLLEKPLLGSLYLAKQYDNPFHSLLATYIAIADPETGVVVKLAGKVTPDPASGQLTASFEENPQLPFEDLQLHLFEGAHGSLRTPPTCGTKTTVATFTPWSAPESGPPAVLADSFETITAPGSGPCPAQASALPNAPRFTAGTITPKAGAYSPFVLRLSREDGSQELKGVDAVLPPGLTGRLAGTAACPESQIAQAQSRSKPGEGALERDHPSCPASSELGTVEVSAGAGPVPYSTSGKTYLAGPYKGAPISMVIVTPAIAGPFDLGTVVVRNALYIDPVTTAVTVKSDPIPTILEGIPLDVRSIEVKISRNNFTLNPTSCEPMSIGATAFGLSSAATLSNRFQAGECSSLKFKPNLKIKLHGATKRAGHPALAATLTYPSAPGYANTSFAQVALPHSEFLDQAHIKTICTRVQFAAGNGNGELCPRGSIYGKATAVSPLLDQPLTGPVYLRSSSNPLPDLVVALQGPASQPIAVDLDGRVDSKNGGIRTTFEAVPDAPVSKFTLEMQGGKKGLLVNSENLCSPKAKKKATVDLSAQNGLVDDFNPTISNGCKSAKKQHKRRSAR